MKKHSGAKPSEYSIKDQAVNDTFNNGRIDKPAESTNENRQAERLVNESVADDPVGEDPINLKHQNNPTLNAGRDAPDGELGSFKQGNAGDCFFLSAITSLANDPEGKSLIEGSIQESALDGEPGWNVTFPDNTENPVFVSKEELDSYRFADFEFSSDGGHATSGRTKLGARGDPDICILEIAADKRWTGEVKPNGLFDDVQPSIFAMFTNSPQTIVYNPEGEGPDAGYYADYRNEDVAKWRAGPAGDKNVTEVYISTTEEAEEQIFSLVEGDTDGLTMGFVDYENAHAYALTDIDLADGTYTVVNPHNSGKQIEKPLYGLFEGMANGRYVIFHAEPGAVA